MKYAVIIVRVLLGLLFVVFGSNAFLHFIPMPPPPEGDAGAFISALMHTGYLFVVATLQVLGGLCLLSGRLTPLGLTLLGPVILNILCFHIFFDRAGLGTAVCISIFSLFLLWAYREKFPAIFNP